MSEENRIDVNDQNVGDVKRVSASTVNVPKNASAPCSMQFATAIAECVNECCDQFDPSCKVSLTPPRGAEAGQGGAMGDLLLGEAEKMLQTLVSTVGPQVISSFIAALKKRIPF